MIGANHQINNVFTMDSYFQLELTIENSQLRTEAHLGPIKFFFWNLL